MLVQPYLKAVEHPTDARPYRKVHAAMLRIAEKESIALCQSYRKLMATAFQKHGSYAKAKQYNRARPVLRSLKNMAGLVFRDVAPAGDCRRNCFRREFQLGHQSGCAQRERHRWVQ